MAAWETILKVLADSGKEMSASDLVVAAWMADRPTFGLDGHREAHPDSNKILAHLMGTDGLVAKGLVDKPRPKVYRITDVGRQVLARLAGEVAQQKAVAEKRITLHGPDAKILTDLFTSAAYDARQASEDVAIADALAFFVPGRDKIVTALQRMRGRLHAGYYIALPSGLCVEAKDVDAMVALVEYLEVRFARELAKHERKAV